MAAPGAPDVDALAEDVATACQVMAEQGLVEHVLGHISVRLGPDELLVRCRGPEEAGLAYTTADDIRRVRLDGTGDLGRWAAPNELPIHTEILRRRPEVTAVVLRIHRPSWPPRCSTRRFSPSTGPTTSPAPAWRPARDPGLAALGADHLARPRRVHGARAARL